MSPEELSTLEVEIKELLRKGFIRESKSPISSPVLFTLKADGSRRMVVDGRQVNAVTIPNSYPLPLISELIDQLGPSRSRPSCSKIFTKVDLRSAYHLLRVKEGDEYKTAFRCQLGLFEFLVAPFGHINSGACFQRFIASLLQGIIGVVFYLDDILIHSDTLENHVPLVRRVFTILRDNQLSCPTGMPTYLHALPYSSPRLPRLLHLKTPQ
ncbi:hypothetical protein CAOG_09197 [Capsaspora owczarzaki ATCC 30864]|uniref:hypothetical protein n=1 Tax=Capsaspora owczarzaki (strain ATCC 30864) TaxID=595528 RepID=UPI0003525C82|nr:hypothetical protein CAOG_09197 [Capsaspora owczarzaki ATCC 30864]|eukprot:XP_011270914.1 hypothetical protein CAOG_09197 [Capsaspora owczarzaki ATCC 30864]